VVEARQGTTSPPMAYCDESAIRSGERRGAKLGVERDSGAEIRLRDDRDETRGACRGHRRWR